MSLRKCCPNCKVYLVANNGKGGYFNFCCNTCKTNPGNHGRSQHTKCQTSGTSKLCKKGCGRVNNPGYTQCCTMCNGTNNNSSHTNGCNSRNTGSTSGPLPTPPTTPTGKTWPCVVLNQSRRHNTKTRRSLYGQNHICFYESGYDYYEFANFWPAPIELNEVEYPTSEHYYQAMKFTNNPAIQQQIIIQQSPSKIFKIAQKNRAIVDSDWRDRSLQTMIDAVRAKFTQHQSLRHLLVNTGNKILVEHTTRDNFYGDGGDGTGTNHLGKILMMVRSEINSGVKQDYKNDGWKDIRYLEDNPELPFGDMPRYPSGNDPLVHVDDLAERLKRRILGIDNY